jgi:hypothetical protein
LTAVFAVPHCECCRCHIGVGSQSRVLCASAIFAVELEGFIDLRRTSLYNVLAGDPDALWSPNGSPAWLQANAQEKVMPP